MLGLLLALLACDDPSGVKPSGAGEDTGSSDTAADTGTPDTSVDTGATDTAEDPGPDTDSGGGADTSEDCPTTFATTSTRGGATALIGTASYDYAPAVILDGVYKMWWCGGVAGDHILYAEASSLDGPWHSRSSSVAGTYDDVFQPTGNPADFDGTHTCDPSVLRVNDTWYMYYGGYPYEGSGGTTEIGVASSPDGITWTRLNGGRPIISPAGDFTAVYNPYGAGQPSAVYKDGYFYVSYTDTTGVDVDGNGGGQFVLRSADPTFQTGVEELGAAGFAPYDPATHTHHSLVYAFGVDWQYSDALDRFVMAVHGTAGETTLHLFDDSLSGITESLHLYGEWAEGPGLASRADKHALPSADCGSISFDVMRAVGPDLGSWDLAHVGMDVSTGLDCACADLPSVLEGCLLESSGMPLTVVRDGVRLQFANSAPATRIARTVVALSNSAYNEVPYGASLYDANLAIAAEGQPGAYVLDDGRIWPVSCLEILTDNNSELSNVGAAEYGSYPVGPALYCLR